MRSVLGSEMLCGWIARFDTDAIGSNRFGILAKVPQDVFV
jgi:hypothetical protein